MSKLNNETLDREYLELLIEQNPKIGKDPLLALLDDIKNTMNTDNPDVIKHAILNHLY